MARLNLKKIPKRKETIKTLLVDLKYLAYRLRYTQGAELTYDEVNTTIIYGVLSSIISLAKKFEINKCVICADIDRASDSRRREQYPQYKMRKQNKVLTEYDVKLNEIFSDEYEKLMEEMDEIGFKINFLPKYEADDLIALYCLKYKNTESIAIITRDEDMYQCLSQNVFIYSPDDKVKKTDVWFKKKYRIMPHNWNQIKAMAGCTSDNVKGIERIGEETALKYMRNEATEKQIQRIEENEDIVLNCLQVVTLPHADLLNEKISFEETNLDIDKFMNFCQRYGMRQFLENVHDFQSYFSK